MKKEVKTQLDEYRESIDNIDSMLVFLLAERFKITEKVGKLKADHNLPATDKNREAKQRERLERLSAKAGIKPGFISRLLTFIIGEVVRTTKNLRKIANFCS